MQVFVRPALITFLFLTLPGIAEAALININTADATSLDTLPGIGAVKAQAIVTYRTEHGRFAATADIKNVSGIGPSTYANIKDLITVGGGSVVGEAEEKPSAEASGYTKVQAVEPVTSPKTSETHAEGTIAPAAVPERPAAGATLSSLENAHAAPISGLIHSPWLFGLAGIIVAASGAFIFL